MIPLRARAVATQSENAPRQRSVTRQAEHQLAKAWSQAACLPEQALAASLRVPFAAQNRVQFAPPEQEQTGEYIQVSNMICDASAR